MLSITFKNIKKQMKFSIIIPTHNRRAQLINCINSIITTTYPTYNYEIIIVNDNSIDDTELYFKKITQSNIRYYNNTGKGPASARNFGAKIAKGMYLIFIDDDCTIDDNYLWLIDKKTNEFSFSLAGGIIINCSKTKFSKVLEYMTLFYQKEQNFSDTPKFLTSNNMICLKKDFFEIGGFDESYTRAGGEDRDLSNRFFISNKNILFFQDLIVFHHHNLNLKSFFKQQYNYGLGAHILRMKNKKLKIKKNKILKIHFNMIISIFKSKNILDGFCYSLIVILSQLIVTLGYISSSLLIKRENRIE